LAFPKKVNCLKLLQSALQINNSISVGDYQHSQNEYRRVGNYLNGIESFLAILTTAF